MAAGTCKGTELLLGVQCASFQGQGLCSTCQLFQEGCGSSALGLLQNLGLWHSGMWARWGGDLGGSSNLSDSVLGEGSVLIHGMEKVG